jgi:hypothetical protein
MQVLQWIQQPTDINSLRDFAEWKEKCDVKVSRSYKLETVLYSSADVLAMGYLL